MEKVVESAKDTKKVKDNTTKEIEQNLLQGLFTLTLRIQILRGSLFWPQKIKLFFYKRDIMQLFSADATIYFFKKFKIFYSFIRDLRVQLMRHNQIHD